MSLENNSANTLKRLNMTTSNERKEHVENMLATLRMQGLKSPPKDELLLQQYVEGAATFEAVHHFAIEFAIEHAGPNADVSRAMLASGHWITYSDDDLVPDAILREWPDGTMEIVDVDDKGKVIVKKELPSKAELSQRREAIRNSIANVQLSGLYPSKEALERMEGYATSLLTWDEYFKVVPLGPPR